MLCNAAVQERTCKNVIRNHSDNVLFAYPLPESQGCCQGVNYGDTPPPTRTVQATGIAKPSTSSHSKKSTLSCEHHYMKQPNNVKWSGIYQPFKSLEPKKTGGRVSEERAQPRGALYNPERTLQDADPET